MKKAKNDARKVFRQKGTCSQTFYYLLNREFGNLSNADERAVDPLAGGIVQRGYQCGMLWGTALAIGAEAYRRFPERDKAIAVAVKATWLAMQSFVTRTASPNCREITRCNFRNPVSIAGYMLSGRFRYCYKLAEEWSPEAIDSAREGLAGDQEMLPAEPVSCASLVIQKMGGSDEDMVKVAGLAGGMGLSGEGCGALGAAIWLRSKQFYLENPGRGTMFNPEARKTLQEFLNVTGSELLCRKICGRSFASLEEHSEFVRSGGCDEIIEALSKQKSSLSLKVLA